MMQEPDTLDNLKVSMAIPNTPLPPTHPAPESLNWLLFTLIIMCVTP